MQTPSKEDYRAALDRVDRFARLMDYDWALPGTRLRIGVDGLIGLLPGVGDIAGALLSLYVVAEAIRLKAGKGLVLRMLGNIGLELIVGLVPVFGDAFDIYWQSNRRNAGLLRRRLLRELEPPEPESGGVNGTVLWLLVLVALAILGGIWYAAL
ncbi:DUF4112 domain-containing protein [Marinobacteraceae bacterium S3BR75-40.1]